MKKFIAFLALSGLISFAAIGQYAKIEGVLLYNNDASKPMNDCKVECKNQYGVSQGIYTTDYEATFGDGYYFFNISQAGTYYISLIDDPPYDFGGINATDAWLIDRYIYGLYSFNDLELEAADVTGDDIIEDDDWQEVCDRFVQIIQSYSGGEDWVKNYRFEIVISSPGNVAFNIATLCLGDVNGSYVPD